MNKGLMCLMASALGLSGCVGGAVPRSASPGTVGAAARSVITVVPQRDVPPGLRGVIGAPAAALTRRFGQARIDLAEGDARTLQFTGTGCVLDIFLYPVTTSAEPAATHVAARQRQGGAAMDPVACIREIESR